MSAMTKTLTDCQMDACVLAVLLKVINDLDMEETCEGVRASLNTIAVERINQLACDLDVLDEETKT
ncbi:MAG: hypothetical protein ACU0CA_14310 [Paracoccaceae bacterium]